MISIYGTKIFPRYLTLTKKVELPKILEDYEDYLYVCVYVLIYEYGYVWRYVSIFATGTHKLWLTKGSVLTTGKELNWEGPTFSYKIEKP